MTDKVTPLNNPFSKDSLGGQIPLSIDKQKQLDDFVNLLKNLNNSDIPYQNKLDKLIELSTNIVPVLFREVLSPAPNVDLSVVAARAGNLLKDISTILIKKREAEFSDEIDTNAPKFQLVFSWFLELFHQILISQGVTDVVINNIFNELASELSGWEEKVTKQLKGLSQKALGSVTNPFIEKFKEQLKKS